MKYSLRVLLLSILTTSIAIAAPNIKVIGLFKDKALVAIDGKHKLIRKGDTYKDFTLEYADSKRAVISYEGISKKYYLGSPSSGGMQFKKAKSSAYHIKANPMGMYVTQGSINSKPMNFIVDTGATMVSMNQADAERLGINGPRDGEEIKVMTASAVVKAYKVKLETVKVGEIQIKDVDATVLLSEQPDTVLLGMSFLKNLRVKQSGSVMSLEKIQ